MNNYDDEKFSWIIKNYPKVRPSISSEYQAIYEEEYKRNRNSRSNRFDIRHLLESWMHKKVRSVNVPDVGSILEIGAGTLNHLDYEPKSCDYDIIEPFKALYEHSHLHARVRNTYIDVNQVPSHSTFDKILSIAVLEHVERLPELIAKSALMLSDEGTAVHAIPSEGGLLWYLAWRYGSGIEFKLRTKLSYVPLMKHEHINNLYEIQKVIKIFYRDVTITRFPLPWVNFSLYSCILAKNPNREMANQYLKLIAS